MSVKHTLALLLSMNMGVAPWLATAATESNASSQDTPAQRAIAKAQGTLARDPVSASAGVELAMAYARRARETSDPVFYARRHEALGPVLAKDPADFEALKAKAWLLLGQHRFAEARELAVALNKRVPDDVMVYGLLTDAATELGDYAAAEEAAQWMLNLRPGNLPALTRAAYLRELFGDVEGALDLMKMALDQTSWSETEERAWLLTQIGHLELSRGNLGPAESVLLNALETFPDYHYALGQMARLRTAQGRHGDAVALERRRYAAASHPENLYHLARAIARTGSKNKSAAAFKEFEQKARAEMDGPDNANRELIFYYLEEGKNPKEALRLATRESKFRRDVFTKAALAWALHRDGQNEAARTEIEGALAVGIHDADVAARAGVIHAALKDRANARKRFDESLRWNEHSELATEVRRRLSRRG